MAIAKHRSTEVDARGMNTSCMKLFNLLKMEMTYSGKAGATIAPYPRTRAVVEN